MITIDYPALYRTCPHLLVFMVYAQQAGVNIAEWLRGGLTETEMTTGWENAHREVKEKTGIRLCWEWLHGNPVLAVVNPEEVGDPWRGLLSEIN